MQSPFGIMCLINIVMRDWAIDIHSSEKQWHLSIYLSVLLIHVWINSESYYHVTLSNASTKLSSFCLGRNIFWSVILNIFAWHTSMTDHSVIFSWLTHRFDIDLLSNGISPLGIHMHCMNFQRSLRLVDNSDTSSSLISRWTHWQTWHDIHSDDFLSLLDIHVLTPMLHG